MMSVYYLLFVVVIIFHSCTGKPTPLSPTISDVEDLNTLPESEEVRTKALDQLRNVFGFTNKSHFSPAKDHSPPQYMMDLYNTIAHSGGITNIPNPYYSSTVRSFLDKSHRQRMLYSFNLTKVPNTDRILRAELHLFKMKPKVKHDNRRQHYYQVHLYKVKTDNPLSVEGAELIGIRLISVQRTGWEVFAVTDVVNSWIANSTTNLGFLMTVTNLNGEVMDDSNVRFAQRGKHHDSKQPNLVLFSDDGRQKPALPKTITKVDPDSAYDYIIETYGDNKEETKTGFKHVMKRDTQTNSTEHANTGENQYRTNTRRSQRTGPCALQPMYVDFQTIGWSDWIISPDGYNANQCSGKCTFPLTNLVNPSNHASVQSLINTLNLDETVGQPCCVPDKTEHITLLYYTDDDNVVLKHFEGMIATSCGCH
ncbi:bone morphogenetic protein 2-like [Antedon mediterranea]|uniref:bone morphogenetic protein 2-like n=1 Tax=Antedon mediterranea TaxID=105859 RepID=UPI003AF626CE